MTLEERARRIVQIVHGQVLAFEPRAAVEEVEREIREAVEESQCCVKCKRAHGLFCRACLDGEVRVMAQQAIKPLEDAAILNGKLKAYEDAAKIAETTPIHWVHGSTVSGEPKHAGECVAQAIRARAAEVAK